MYIMYGLTPQRLVTRRHYFALSRAIARVSQLYCTCIYYACPPFADLALRKTTTTIIRKCVYYTYYVVYTAHYQMYRN